MDGLPLDPRLVVGAVLLATAALVLRFTFQGSSARAAMARQHLLAPRTTDGATAPRSSRPSGNRLASVGGRIAPATSLAELKAQLSLADLGASWTIERILVAKVVLGAAAGAAGLWRFIVTPRPIWLLVAAVGAVLAFWLPDLHVRDRARKRGRAIELQFPHVLDQITVMVESGLSFDNSLQRVVVSGEGPLIDELSRVLQDLELGVRRNDALAALAERTPLLDLRLFVTAIIQSTEYGISIGSVLRASAEDARDKRRAYAEEQAQKIPVKIILPMVFCILPALFVVLLGPAVARIVSGGLVG